MEGDKHTVTIADWKLLLVEACHAVRRPVCRKSGDRPDLVGANALPFPAVTAILGRQDQLLRRTVATKELKGKTVSLGGLVDISTIYFNRMMEAQGLKPGAWDVIVIGATGARFAALKSGAVDATMLLPPFNFHAEAAGFRNIGLVIDYAKDLPFTGLEATRDWADKHRDVIERLLRAMDKSVAFFYDDAHRKESVDIMTRTVKLDAEDVVKSYDFLRKIDYFAHDATVSRHQLASLIKAMQGIGDIGTGITVDRLVMPGLTKLAD